MPCDTPSIFRPRRLSILFILAVFSVALWWTAYNGSYLTAGIIAGEIAVPVRKELVVASIYGDNTTWIERCFPNWGRSIYVNNDPAAKLTVPVNKGREGMTYLTFIIDNYHDLPDFMVFMHGQRYQWHNDDPERDGAPAIRNLRLPYLVSQGYLNLRCTWNIGCDVHLRPIRPVSRQSLELSYAEAFGQLFPGISIPEEVAASCCAQFAVTREKVLERPKSDYVGYRIWLLKTKLEDELSGRILEYSWHIIFGMPAIHCPDMAACYCNAFGICGLNCTLGECDRYRFSKDGLVPEHDD